MASFADWLERHQLLVTGIAAVIASAVAFGGTVVSAHMQADAAINQATASRDAAKIASDATLATITLQLAADRTKQSEAERNRRYALASAVSAQLRTFSSMLADLAGKNELGNACNNFNWVKERYPKIPDLFVSSWQDLAILPANVQAMIYAGRSKWRFEDFPDTPQIPVSDSAGCNAFFKLRFPDIEKQEAELKNALAAVMTEAAQ